MSFEHDVLVVTSRNISGQRQARVFGQQVIFPTFEIATSPTISIGEVKSRRFDIMDRHTQKMKNQIMEAEDQAIFDALDILGNDPNTSWE